MFVSSSHCISLQWLCLCHKEGISGVPIYHPQSCRLLRCPQITLNLPVFRVTILSPSFLAVPPALTAKDPALHPSPHLRHDAWKVRVIPNLAAKVGADSVMKTSQNEAFTLCSCLLPLHYAGTRTVQLMRPRGTSFHLAPCLLMWSVCTARDAF